MPSKTFILGAGFSADAGFPLARDLIRDLPAWIEAERHPSAEPHLTPNLHGYPQGQFCAGWDAVDPTRSMGFEECMIAARNRLSSANQHDPTYVFHRVMRDSCGRLIWDRQRKIRQLSAAYVNFGSWFHEHHSYGLPNAIVSFNWDLLAEKILTDASVVWRYSAQSPFVPILKPHGSINWSDHMERGWRAESPEWQPIGVGSDYCYIAESPSFDPFESGANQRLRKLFLPGDPEEQGAARLIWSEAKEAIREREVVVFIGYSLPAYDSSSMKFLQRAVSGKQVEVYARSSETLDHYRRALGHVSTTVPLAFAGCPYSKSFSDAANA